MRSPNGCIRLTNPSLKPFPRARSSVSGEASTPTTGEKDLTIKVRVSSLLSAILESGLPVDDRPNRAKDKDDLPFGEPDRDRIPESVLERELGIEGLAFLKGSLETGVSMVSSVEGDRVLRTSSAGRGDWLGGWPAGPSPCEVMDYGSQVRYLAACRL